MGHLEKNELTLPISSPEFKPEIAANNGLNCQQRCAENRRLRPSWRTELDSNSWYGRAAVAIEPSLRSLSPENGSFRGFGRRLLPKWRAILPIWELWR
jgi:hypothetical protein